MVHRQTSGPTKPVFLARPRGRDLTPAARDPAIRPGLEPQLYAENGVESGLLDARPVDPVVLVRDVVDAAEHRDPVGDARAGVHPVRGVTRSAARRDALRVAHVA